MHEGDAAESTAVLRGRDAAVGVGTGKLLAADESAVPEAAVGAAAGLAAAAAQRVAKCSGQPLRSVGPTRRKRHRAARRWCGTRPKGSDARRTTGSAETSRRS